MIQEDESIDASARYGPSDKAPDRSSSEYTAALKDIRDIVNTQNEALIKLS